MNIIKYDNFRLCARCFTYNQSDYILDAMNGFTMQQTSFPYVCVIVDDASTDGEQNVIRNYLIEKFNLEDKSVVRNEETADYLMTFAQHKTNRNCFFAVYYLKYNHYSIKKRKMPYIVEWTESVDYTAVCEGDDFWISPEFLQLSVSYLDDHSDYSCVFGNRVVCNENATQFKTTKFKGDLTVNDIMHGYNMGLRNLCFRCECQNAALQNVGNRDLYVYYRCAVSGKMKYMDKDFAVYRITGKGVCTSIKGKQAIFTCFQHYYTFHEITDFKYQKEYVNYQIRQLIRLLYRPHHLWYGILLMHKFHIPCKCRYWWYLKYLINNMFLLINRLIKL